MGDNSVSTGGKNTCVIDDTIAEFALTTLNARLINRWNGETGERLGVRKLADYYNVEVLRELLREAGDQIPAEQAEYLYDILSVDPTTDDTDVTVSQQEDWRSTLSEVGIDVDEVQRQYFVSYATMHSHLTKCLGETAPDVGNSRTVADDKDMMRRLASKSEKIASAAIKRQTPLDKAGVDRFEFDGDVRIRCDKCGYKNTLVQFLAKDGCYCDDVSVGGDANSESTESPQRDLQVDTVVSDTDQDHSIEGDDGDGDRLSLPPQQRSDAGNQNGVSSSHQ